MRGWVGEAQIDGERWVFPLLKCGYCGEGGYDPQLMNKSDKAKANLKFDLETLPMIVRQVTKEGVRYNPLCLPCVDRSVWPDNKEKKVKE